MCGCSKSPTPQASARASAPVDSFAVASEQQIGTNEVLVRWLHPTVRNVYRPSPARRGKQYNQVWQHAFAMLKTDAEGKYKDEVDVGPGV